jgi:hypothetical protein
MRKFFWAYFNVMTPAGMIHVNVDSLWDVSRGNVSDTFYEWLHNAKVKISSEYNIEVPKLILVNCGVV